MRRRNQLLIVVVAVVALAGLFLLVRRKGAMTQPIAFNHRLHAGTLKLECSHCHVGVENGPFATLPSVEICMGCHVAPLSENPEEEKVRKFAEEGRIPWQRLTRLPDHVYFSHQRHVAFGKVACELCHGKMAERNRPPARAPKDLSMGDCLDCHRKNSASEDCISCHR